MVHEGFEYFVHYKSLIVLENIFMVVIIVDGEMAEWSKAVDSKSTVRFLRTGGSNPSLSAISAGGFLSSNKERCPSWPKEHDWKSCVCSKGAPGVRIPLSPQPENLSLGSPATRDRHPILNAKLNFLSLFCEAKRPEPGFSFLLIKFILFDII
jgi:hypothetical protein